jgi:hypothetical protein
VLQGEGVFRQSGQVRFRDGLQLSDDETVSSEPPGRHDPSRDESGGPEDRVARLDTAVGAYEQVPRSPSVQQRIERPESRGGDILEVGKAPEEANGAARHQVGDLLEAASCIAERDARPSDEIRREAGSWPSR